MKQSFLACFLMISVGLTAQVETVQYEQYPVFPTCENSGSVLLQQCFTNTLRQFVYDNFELPESVAEKNYRGTINVLFEVSRTGKFNVLYIDGTYDELKTEVKRVFEMLPVVEPATYNGNPTYVQFSWPITIPLTAPGSPLSALDILEEKDPRDKLVDEYDDLVNLPYESEEYKSNINIPLSHSNYSRFDAAMNRVGLNSHTAQKPYTYDEVNKYYDFQAENANISKERTTWFGRKFWNEHFFTIKGKDYWLTLDPGVDLQAGKDFDRDINTYNNTRLVYTQGGIGKNLSFFAVIYESQGRFAGYFNDYAESIKAYSYPAIIPGRGIAKGFRTDSYDYPGATGHISYSPSKHFNAQLGHGKNFLGDGYRSLLMSDNASPYPFFKLNTTFWKLKYTNTWMSLRDVRPEVTDGGSYRTKYMASHYLSYNITKRLNLGFFE